jgi:hypothetical protein
MKDYIFEYGYLKDMQPLLDYLYDIILKKFNNKITTVNKITYNIYENITLKEYNINGLNIKVTIVNNDYMTNHGYCSEKFDFYGDFDIYDAEIGIILNVNNEENIKYILSHELLHLYQLIKSFNNIINNKDIKNTEIYQNLYNTNDVWNYFINALYYFINSEESARINSILYYIKNKNPESPEESWKFFKNSEEYKNLNNYKNFNFKKHLNNVKNIDSYITKFRELKGDRTKDRNHFIRYWSNVIKSKIEKYEKKLYKKINLLNFELFSNGNTLNECRFFKDIPIKPITEFRQKITYSLKPPNIYN